MGNPMRDVVHVYFKREFEDHKIIVRVNPVDWSGEEITVYDDGEMFHRKLQFDEDIHDDLSVDGFESSSPLEFNLYLKGFKGSGA
jgi:hypothetical protein